MTDVPRGGRLPQQVNSTRLDVITTHMAGGSLHGQTRAARPVRSSAPTRPGTALVGGSLSAAARFQDPGTPSYGSGGNHPSDLVDSQGDVGSWFAYNGGFGIDVLTEGWIQVSADAYVSGLNPGDVVRVEILVAGGAGAAGSMSGYAYADDGGNAYPWVTTLPFYATPPITVIEMAIDTVHVVGFSTIADAGINLVAFGAAQ